MKKVITAIGKFFELFHFELIAICLSLIILSNTYTAFEREERLNNKDRIIKDIFQKYPDIKKQYENLVD